MKKRILLFAVILAVAACSRPSGERGYHRPEGPYIVDAFTCRGVSQDGQPVGVTDYFLRDDDITLWILWDNYTDYHQVNVDWIMPNGSTYFSDSLVIDGDGVVVTYFTLHTDPFIPTGEWEAAIWLDGAFERSILFFIDEQK